MQELEELKQQYSEQFKVVSERKNKLHQELELAALTLEQLKGAIFSLDELKKKLTTVPPLPKLVDTESNPT